MPENVLASSSTSSTSSSTLPSTAPSTVSSAPPSPIAASGRVTRQPPVSTPVRQRAIDLGDTTITYRHRISPRARRLRFEVRPGNGLEVTTPPGVSVARIEAVMREKTRWITTMLVRYAQPPGSVVAAPLATGTILPFAGGHLRLVLQTPRTGTRTSAEMNEGELRLTIANDAPETVRSALEAWYRRQGRRVFAERVAYWNMHYGFTFGRIAIRDQKSRWGSCSRQGNLNFNWRLLLAPTSVLDYIVIHELSHLREGNHSSRFWALVAECCPSYREQRDWLRLHGPELHF